MFIFHLLWLCWVINKNIVITIMRRMMQINKTGIEAKITILLLEFWINFFTGWKNPNPPPNPPRPDAPTPTASSQDPCRTCNHTLSDHITHLQQPVSIASVWNQDVWNPNFFVWISVTFVYMSEIRTLLFPLQCLSEEYVQDSFCYFPAVFWSGI